MSSGNTGAPARPTRPETVCGLPLEYVCRVLALRRIHYRIGSPYELLYDAMPYQLAAPFPLKGHGYRSRSM